MVYLPKSLQVYYKIKKDIEQHYYARFSFLPAERKLSELYQVQRSTVRKALEKLTEENYIIKKPGAGNQVIWSNAKTSNSAQSILYVIPSHEFEQRNQPFHWEIFTVLESLCRAENITLSFLKLNKNDTLSSLSHNFQAADGIIWVTEINPIFFETAKKNAIPSVLICNNYPDFPRINLADRDGIFMATNHLIKKGCKRIAFMRGLSSYMNTPARYEGYQLALRAHNITPDPSLEIDGDWTYSNAISAITDAIAHGLLFDGIVCSNDLMALGTIRALQQQNIAIPDQVRVVGMDNIQNDIMVTPTLSTFSFSKRDIALAAFSTLKALMRGAEVPKEIIIPGHLIERESSL